MLFVAMWGAGQASLVAGVGVTIRVPASKGLNLTEQYSMGGVIKVGTNEWLAFGDLTA